MKIIVVVLAALFSKSTMAMKLKPGDNEPPPFPAGRVYNQSVSPIGLDARIKRTEAAAARLAFEVDVLEMKENSGLLKESNQEELEWKAIMLAKIEEKLLNLKAHRKENF